MAYLFAPLFSPLLLLLLAIYAARHPGRRPGLVPKLTEAAAFCAFAVATMAAILLVMKGPGTSALIGLYGIGLSVRLAKVHLPLGCP